jgi:hypothetical protein
LPGLCKLDVEVAEFVGVVPVWELPRVMVHIPALATALQGILAGSIATMRFFIPFGMTGTAGLTIPARHSMRKAPLPESCGHFQPDEQ